MSEGNVIQISDEFLRRHTEIEYKKDSYGDTIIFAIVEHPGFPQYLYRISIEIEPDKIEFFRGESVKDSVRFRVKRRSAETYPRGKYPDTWTTELRSTYCNAEEVWKRAYDEIRSNLIDVWRHQKRQREQNYRKRQQELRANYIANTIWSEAKYQGVEEASKGEENEETECEG